MPRWPQARFGKLAGRCAGLLVCGVWFVAVAWAQESAAPPARDLPRPERRLPLDQRYPLVVGATSDSFPYGYVEEDGRLTGFSTDLLDAVARVMHLQIRREVMAGGPLQDQFKAGTFDLLQDYNQAPERDEYADFSVPLLALQGCIFVRQRGSPIHRLEDFNGREFAIIGPRSVGEQFLADHHLHPRILYVDSSEEGLRAVDSGRCAGVFISQLTASSLIERAGLRNLTVFGEPLEGYDIRHCYAVHKGDPQLLARLNEGLAILHSNGEFNAIYRKWFGRFGPAPGFTGGEVIRYVTGVLALGLVFAVWGYIRQRALRRSLSRQAAQLAEKEALLQALYDNIPMAMWVLEAETGGERVLAINRQAETHGSVPALHAPGFRLAELGLRPEWVEVFEQLLRWWPGETGFVREERRLAATGKYFVFTLVPLAPGAAGRQRICVLAEDITQRRQLDAEIAQTRRLRAVGELVGGIAHEFNNLLTPVMLKTSEIELDWPDDARLQREVAIIMSAAKRAAELTGRLLTFGRKAEQGAEAVQLAGVVESCFALLRQTNDRRIRWESSVPGDLPPLYFNATDLNQILINLLLNARDTLLEKLAQTPSDWNPRIRVEVRALPAGALPVPDLVASQALLGWQEITVQDNGLGMLAAVRERIFEPFYTTKEVGKGTGLGLATVWHLVTEAGGRIQVESTPGEGSLFRVQLPVLPVREPETPALPPPPPRPPGAARVFLAEDEPLVASTVCTALERMGHRATQQSDGIGAWEHLRPRLGDYALLIFDVNMPGLSGIELARRVRDARYAGRILIISGRLAPPELQELEGLGVDRVLPKPFTMDEFVEAVRACLGSAGGNG